VLVHQRLDFMLYSIDQVVNWMAPWRFHVGRGAKMPVTIRAIIGKGWAGSAAHQEPAHLVRACAGPAGRHAGLAGGREGPPALEHHERRSDAVHRRSLAVHDAGGRSDEPYFIRLGEALVRRPGRDVTLITMARWCRCRCRRRRLLSKANIDAEVVDLRCLMPLDVASVIRSVRKTGRLVVAEPGWRMYGAAAEIIATVVETLGEMRSRPRRVAWPQSAVPTSSKLEEQFYPTSDDIVAAAVQP